MLVHEGVTFELVWLGALMSLVASASTGIGGLPVLFLKEISHRTLDTMLGFAAGAMAFVVSHEMIPESHREGHEIEATFGFILGFAVMMFLDTIFG